MKDRLNLLAALAKAISEMPDPKKNARNDHFKNQYADLGQVLECVQGPLAANGLLMLQTIEPMDAGAVLRTHVIHVETGESVTSDYPLAPEKPGPQPLGSCVTYARRYALKTLLGMVDVDTDGREPDRERKPAGKAKQPEPLLLEEAVPMIERASSHDQLKVLAHRCAALIGSDRKGVQEALAKRKAEIENEIANIPF